MLLNDFPPRLCASCEEKVSPDGRRILIPSFDSESKRVAVLLYDRDTKKISRIFEVPALGTDKGGNAISVTWTADGKQGVAVWSQADDKLMVAVLPLGIAAPTRLFDVSTKGREAAASLMLPPPIVGRHLFLGGESISRLDLETGETTTAGIESEVIYLEKHRNQILYVCGKDKTGEVGTLDPERLTRKPLFQFKADNNGGGPFLAVTKDGLKIALVTGEEKEPRIAIYQGSELVREIAVGSESSPITLRNIFWSADEKTIYTAGFRERTNDSGGLQFELCEIPVGGNPMRETPLFELPGSLLDSMACMLQIALSPDGKTLAASSALAEEAGHALYLVDMTSSKRKVTKIPIPVPANTKSKAPKN